MSTFVIYDTQRNEDVGSEYDRLIDAYGEADRLNSVHGATGGFAVRLARTHRSAFQFREQSTLGRASFP